MNMKIHTKPITGPLGDAGVCVLAMSFAVGHRVCPAPAPYTFMAPQDKQIGPAADPNRKINQSDWLQRIGAQEERKQTNEESEKVTRVFSFVFFPPPSDNSRILSQRHALLICMISKW